MPNYVDFHIYSLPVSAEAKLLAIYISTKTYITDRRTGAIINRPFFESAQTIGRVLFSYTSKGVALSKARQRAVANSALHELVRAGVIKALGHRARGVVEYIMEQCKPDDRNTITCDGQVIENVGQVIENTMSADRYTITSSNRLVIKKRERENAREIFDDEEEQSEQLLEQEPERDIDNEATMFMRALDATCPDRMHKPDDYRRVAAFLGTTTLDEAMPCISELPADKLCSEHAYALSIVLSVNVWERLAMKAHARRVQPASKGQSTQEAKRVWDELQAHYRRVVELRGSFPLFADVMSDVELWRVTLSSARSLASM